MMGKNISIYLDEKELAVVDRMARKERRSRSSMIAEVIRRYASLAKQREIEKDPIFRTFSDEEIEGWLREDRKISPGEAARYRKLLGLD
jgi:hypothetical protein